mgnify:CR=1 FL=1
MFQLLEAGRDRLQEIEGKIKVFKFSHLPHVVWESGYLIL